MPEYLNGRNDAERHVHETDGRNAGVQQDRGETITQFVHGLIEVGKQRQGIGNESCKERVAIKQD